MDFKGTKFSLNDEELTLLSDPSFFIKKRNITNRISELFGILETEYERVALNSRELLPAALFDRRGKISRGENYKGFPYVILDYPATFEKDGVFAYRTLMWWGHPFSFTFHVAGKYFDRYHTKLIRGLAALDKDALICINSSQWEHHHESTNFIPVAEYLEGKTDSQQEMQQKRFIKLSKTVALHDHHAVIPTGIHFLEEMFTLLK